jgi:hypothetical protein
MPVFGGRGVSTFLRQREGVRGERLRERETEGERETERE